MASEDGMKSTWIFAVIVAGLAGFTVYDQISGEKHEAAKAANAKVVKLKREDINEITIQNQNETHALKKIANHWRITQPFDESADQQLVFSYLDQIMNESTISTVSTQGDFAKYGLDRPLFVLTVATPTAKETVSLGHIKAYDGSLYARIDSEPNIVLVRSAWDLIVSKPIKDFRDTKVYHGPQKIDFKDIKVTGVDRENDPINFEFKNEDGEYVLQGAKDPTFQPAVRAWLEQVKALRGVAFVDHPVQRKVGATLTFTPEQGEPFVLQITRDPDKREQFYVSSTDLPGGLKSQVIAGTAIGSILVHASDFFDKRMPFSFKMKDVTEVKFSAPKKNLTTKIDPQHPDPLLNQIHDLEAVRFLGPPTGKNKFPSHLTLLDSKGTVVFEMSWGEAVTEHATLDTPEARYLPVVTNLSKQVVGVPEKQIEDLAKGK